MRAVERPLIALTQRVDVREDGERRDALDQRWHRVLATLGAVALILPNDPAQALDLVATLRPRGIILTGGNTLMAYGGDAPERDATESALLDCARIGRLAVLGVCRGMQMMLLRDGGELHRVEGHVQRSMTIRAENRRLQVNSYHDLALRSVPPGWRAWASGPGGVIKGARHDDLPWSAIMWHPEREPQLPSHDEGRMRALFQLPGVGRCEG
ncbi:MAG: gamma-glutamyl-gamma-aminobutyrate hydrolase family protein [Nannocystaceae bacterium]